MNKIILSALIITFTTGTIFAQSKKAVKVKVTPNEQVVLDFEKKAWYDKNEVAVDKLISKYYIQHNPQSGDGPASIKGMFPYVSPKINTIRMFSEGDLVFQHNLSKGWGDTNTYVSMDVFRVKNGQIVEHWDAMQVNAEKTVSGHTMTDGETTIKNLKETSANKKVVQGFLDDCIYGGNFQNISKHISTKKYIQHNPNVGDGLQGFNDAMKQMQEHGMTMKYEKTYRVIAEGNFVFVHSKGEFAGKQVAFMDLMRVENGKIVEHWDVIQDAIPAEKTKSGHDMFEQLTK